IGCNHFDVLRRAPPVAHVTGHLLVLEGLARVLPVAGRAMAAMGDRHAMGGAKAAEVPPLHGAREALADRRASHVDELTREEMVSGQFSTDVDERVGAYS